MENRLPPNRFRMLDTMEDIRQNCKGRIYANIFTVKEFATTFKIWINTVYKLCKIKDFPVIQIGGKKYIIANDFNEWVMQNVGKVIELKWIQIIITEHIKIITMEAEEKLTILTVQLIYSV